MTQDPMPEDDIPAEDSGTLFISKSSIPEHDCKPGDTISFEVVSNDGEDIELKFSGYGGETESGPEEDDIRTEVRSAFAVKPKSI